MARIDHTIVQKLATVLLAAVSGDVAGYFPGDPEPRPDEHKGAWFRLLRVDVTPSPRVMGSSAQVDHAAVTIAVNVFVSPGQTRESSYAIGNALALVAAALDEKRSADAATGHVLQLHRAESLIDEDPSAQRGLRSGAVIATGVCRRESTATVADVMTPDDPPA